MYSMRNVAWCCVAKSSLSRVVMHYIVWTSMINFWQAPRVQHSPAGVDFMVPKLVQRPPVGGLSNCDAPPFFANRIGYLPHHGEAQRK